MTADPRTGTSGAGERVGNISKEVDYENGASLNVLRFLRS